jgi:hypothetical protein
VLLLSQMLLIRLRKFGWHRAMGTAAAALVAVMVITGYMVIFGKPRPTAFTRAFIFRPILSLVHARAQRGALRIVDRHLCAVAAADDRVRPGAAEDAAPRDGLGAVVLLARHPLHAAIAYTDQWQRLAAWLTPPV